MAGPDAVFILLLKKHWQGGTKKLGLVLMAQSGLYISCPGGPALLFCHGDLAGHVGSGRSGTAGVRENVHGRKAYGIQEFQGGGEFRLRLLGEAYDQVRGDGTAGEIFPQKLAA